MKAETLLIISFISPLIGFLVSIFIQHQKHNAVLATCVLMGIALISYLLFLCFYPITYAVQIEFFQWIKVDKLRINWGFYGDALTYVMLGIVLMISFFVHLYSVAYMAHDPHIVRFMSYLSFFTFMMLLLITAPNLLQLFVGWEGVGLASYLLIGFWQERPKANAAAIKAFVVNRVGDLGLILGICATFMVFETLDFHTLNNIFYKSEKFYLSFWSYNVHAPTLIAFLLLIGAMGKSAQFGLHTWLPDAMEGPTPVSALIHAATMVTAGIFLVARLSPLYEMTTCVKEFMVLIGLLTSFFGATVALTQYDIKKVIAYSTCSQLGFMMMACGCGAYNLAIFHLMTHAFFKALLFLGAGSVIHAMSDEQDIRQMGGLRHHVPQTYLMMWIGSLALGGIPFLSGFYSKDAILAAIYHAYPYLFWAALFISMLTAFYSFRLLFLVFHGPAHADEHVIAHIHESPPKMMISLYILALGAVIMGWLGHKWMIEEQWGFKWNKAIIYHPLEIQDHFMVVTLAVSCAFLGIGMAYIFYIGKKDKLGQWRENIFYKFLANKWYVDEMYQILFVRPTLWLGSIFWVMGDRLFIDGLGPNAVSETILELSKKNRKLQTGYIFHYAFIMVTMLVIILSIFMVFDLIPLIDLFSSKAGL